MSNKRIDLTQFEEITKGKWQWFTGDGKKGLALFPSVEENDDILLWDESDPLAANQYTANAEAIAAVPDLIAELKRCYERIDEIEKEPSVTIDEWDIPSQGPCVTVRYSGREYVGTLEEWESEEE